MTTSWHEIRNSFLATARKAVEETEELAEDAALAIKKKKTEARLSDAYAALGRSVYPLLSEEDAVIRTDEKLLSAAQEVDRCRAELNEIVARIRSRSENGKKDGGASEGRDDA